MFTGWPGARRHDRDCASRLALIAATRLHASFDDRRITTIYLGGLAGSFVVLLGLAARHRAYARRSAASPQSAIWRYALSNLHRPGSAAQSVILALGLGLTLFVTLALTDRTICDRTAAPASRTRARLLLPRCPQ